jgi:hypothetical protein
MVIATGPCRIQLRVSQSPNEVTHARSISVVVFVMHGLVQALIDYFLYATITTPSEVCSIGNCPTAFSTSTSLSMGCSFA